MLAEIYYLIRSKSDGSYLTARLSKFETEKPDKYLLVFTEDSQALSYLNTHGSGLIKSFMIESVSTTQLKGVLNRWEFKGVGIVKDPLIPDIEFFTRE